MPFAIDSATRIIAERVESSSSGKAASRICCYQCGRIVAPDLLRSHVGEHILRALLGVEETNLQEKVHRHYPCGFCGRTGCQISLLKTSSSYQPVSRCLRAQKFTLAAAKKHSNRMKSTNAPIHCDLCDVDPATKQKPVFWKYNMFQHIHEKHPSHWDPATSRTTRLSKTFIKAIDAELKELQAIAPGATQPYPIPDPDVVSEPRRDVDDGSKHASKRIKFS
ncbi:hypothetical protein FOMPIDRAFT_64854 [Fomitopsis schrenkii]|uniref:Uncharacterized protein n=1 Tax=Fomitopsis schrenkii TaxID=2126942 RepID=S8E429_FOMSC|nr:hypothetical protein FOMPIDRAFT_64854 [Fomitopsis schrenkii]